MALSDRDTVILDIASRTYKHPGAKTTAILTELHMTQTRYSQVLTALLEHPDAEAERPALIRRLRRLRDARRVQRAA